MLFLRSVRQIYQNHNKVLSVRIELDGTTLLIVMHDGKRFHVPIKTVMIQHISSCHLHVMVLTKQGSKKLKIQLDGGEYDPEYLLAVGHPEVHEI